MSESTTCKTCGTKRTSEICPACLMKRGFEPTASEEAAPVEPSQFDATRSFAGPPRKPVELHTGQVFGGHRIVKKLGHGGMGTVYEAEQLESGRRVALKVLSHSLDNQEARTRFLREGRLAASVNHPNSVYVFGTEEIEGTPAISMELVSGGTLERRVRKSGTYPVAEAVDAILQVIAGLEAAETKGVLHRDIKPANCFVDKFGAVKVGDFGLSISTAPRDDYAMTNVTREGTFLGTPAFASPEQLRGDQLDTRSDIYAVGVTLFYLLTGKTPFSGRNMVQLLATVLDTPAPDIRELNPDVPPQLAATISKCLSKSPGTRPPSYAALREALLPFSTQTRVPALLGQRFLAGLCDYAILTLVWILTFNLIWSWLGYKDNVRASIIQFSCFMLISMAYFVYYESKWGMSLGKRLLGLKVVQNQGNPTVVVSSIRAVMYCVLPYLPTQLLMLSETSGEFLENVTISPFIVAYLPYVILAILFSTARRRNGAASIYDLLTGTRVVLQPKVEEHCLQTSALEKFVATEDSHTIGPYHVLQKLNFDESQAELYLAYDTNLMRRVWIHQVSEKTPQVQQSDRDLSRRSRLRWLGGKRSSEESWDCYEAVEGLPFLTAIQQTRDWSLARKSLQSIHDELQLALKDHTLPSVLSIHNLWMMKDGAIKLLPTTFTPVQEDAVPISDQESAEPDCHEFLRMLTLLCIKECKLDAGSGASGVPVRIVNQTEEIADSVSLDHLSEIFAQNSAKQSRVTNGRRVGLAACCLGVPIIMFVTMFVSSLQLKNENQHEMISLVFDASYYGTIKNIYPNNPEHVELVEQLEIYIAGTYADIVNSPEDWNSSTFSGLQPSQRQEIEDLVATLKPTPKELEKATDYWQNHKDSTGQVQPADISSISLAGSIILGLGVWLQFVWLPSLVTALLFRGGLILRGLDITLVTKDNQPASRIRMLLRMVIPGIPFLMLVGGTFLTGGYLSLIATPSHGGLATLAVGGVLITLYSIYYGRFLSDRIVGTYLVPR